MPKAIAGVEEPLPYPALPVTLPQSVTVTLTADDILHLTETPYPLVASPGAGFKIVPVFSDATFLPGTTPYDTTDAADPTIIYGVAADFAIGVPVCSVALFTQVSSSTTVRTLISTTGINGHATVDLDNHAIYLYNGGTEFSLGDGTLKITIQYNVTPTS